MSKKCFYIYVLYRQAIPFYVGITVNPKGRENIHKSRFKFNFRLVVVEELTCSRPKAMKIERQWISRFSTAGFDLMNIHGIEPERIVNNQSSGSVRIRPQILKEAKAHCKKRHYKIGYFITLAVKEKLERQKKQL